MAQNSVIYGLKDILKTDMHFEFLTEEISAVAALRVLVPKIVPSASCSFHPYQGKYDLLKKIPNQLKGYSRLNKKNWKYIVLIDKDQDDCLELKRRINKIAEKYNFIAHSDLSNEYYNFLCRIAVEELEAWFFGDLKAISTAYPRVHYQDLLQNPKLRDPDKIEGGTWEELFRILKQTGYYRRGLPKVKTAVRIANHMSPDVNRSRSFQVFRDGLKRISKIYL